MEKKITIVLDRLRSAHNVGNIFRIAEAVGADIAGCGYTALPPHDKLEKTAMGTDKTVPFRHFETSVEAVKTLKAEGYKMVLAVESGYEEKLAWECDYDFPLALILLTNLSNAFFATCSSLLYKSSEISPMPSI